MKFAVSPHGDQWKVLNNDLVVFQGSYAEVESFLDLQENRERQQTRRVCAAKRVAKLVNWLYNQLK